MRNINNEDDPYGLAKKKTPPKPTISNKTKEAFNDALADIQSGGGVPRLDDAGNPKVYGGRENPKWAGAIEYEVPGLDNKHRILKYEGLTSAGDSYTKYGFTMDHYKKIQSDWNILKVGCNS